MTIRGRAAERAVQLACVHYRKAGRADISKQATGMRKFQGGYRYTTKSPIDFKGTIAGGRSICIEVKEHAGVSFPVNESTISSKQRDALDVAVKMGGEVWLIIDLPDAGETYALEWTAVQTFLAAPYRHSLSLQFLRAHGFVVKASGRNTDDFRIWALDMAPHPGRATAYLAEAAERASKPVIDLDAVPERVQQISAPSTAEERRQRVIAATEMYLKKNRKTTWGGR